MSKLLFVVEGKAELLFVQRVLLPHFAELTSYRLTTGVRTVTTKVLPDGSRLGGGGTQWSKWRKEVANSLRDVPQSGIVTTMFDLYGCDRVAGFPGIAQHWHERDTGRRVILLEAAMAREFDDARLVPYIQRHEFEALVLAALSQIVELLDPASRVEVERLRATLGGLAPEEVNCGKATAPSKRLRDHVAGFSKVVHGVAAAAACGLQALRRDCPHFGEWLATLEGRALEAAPPP